MTNAPLAHYHALPGGRLLICWRGCVRHLHDRAAGIVESTAPAPFTVHTV